MQRYNVFFMQPNFSKHLTQTPQFITQTCQALGFKLPMEHCNQNLDSSFYMLDYHMEYSRKNIHI